ncbi:Golgi-associated plant pathogenesis-related protein 1-like [Aethina tumida]|uniref:Golgi-associated plant pathogenesis-related protein 1-like n=1 Tax=Aethina tumida TaxID=116153 RepID=UPI002148E22D|nr:Golgi-associated plant pathogenesis-related protein 1-like [Aethina tumida]
MSELENCFKAHNDYRAKHGGPPLKSVLSVNNGLNIWPGTTLSNIVGEVDIEKIYITPNSNPNCILKGHEAVDTWYDEINRYNFNRYGFSKNTGHFTQVVWRGSQELGVGIARAGNKTYVCNYYPPGNYRGQFQENVLPADTSAQPTNI